MDTGNEKLVGTLRLNLQDLRADISKANEILKDIEKIKIDSIDDESGKKSIEILRQLENEFNNLKKTSGTVFDTSIFKELEETIKNLGVTLNTTTTKVTNFYDSDIKGAQESAKAIKTVTESVDELGRKYKEIKGTYKDESGAIVDKKPETSISDDYATKAKQEVKAEQELQDAIAKTIQSRNEENTKLEQNQAKAVNKSLEEEYTDRQKLAEQMAKVHNQSDLNIQQRTLDLENQQIKSLEQEEKDRQSIQEMIAKTIQKRQDEEKLLEENQAKVINKSLEQEYQDRQTIQDAIAKTIQKRQTENTLLEQNQAKAINKALEQEYQDRIKLADAMEKQNLASLKEYTQEKANLSQYNQMTQTLSKISGEKTLAMGSGNANNTFADRMKISAAYAFAAQNIYMVRQAFVDAISTNKDYEASLTDLKRILGNVSQNDLKAYGDQAIQFAKNFGVALNAVQTAMSSLAAAGVQDKTSLTSMTNTVLLGVNTSDIKDASTMTDLLTSSMKQLGISYTDSEKVLDTWNASADKHIAKTSDYAEAVSKAGMTSKIMGVNLNELNGIISVLADNTGKSGSEIGDALKSVETRLERPKTLKTLKEYGIEVMKDKDHFLDFGQIVTNINTALEKYGDNTVQSNDILDAVGGTMRKDDFAVLAKNWNQVATAAKQSADSQGYSATKNAATMDTLAKKVEVFNATVKQFYISMGDGGLMGQMKGVVDLGTWFMGAGSGMASFLLTLGEVTLAIKAFSGATKIVTGQNLTQWLDKLNLSFANLGKVTGFDGRTASVKAYDSAVQSLTKQITEGNITAKESSAILEVVGQKCGLATSSTNTLAAAEKALKDAQFASSAEGKALATEIEAIKTAEQASIVTDEEKVASEEALSIAQKSTAASSLALKIAMGALTMGITLAISGIIEFASWLSQADERQKEALENSANAAKSYDDQQKSLEDLVNQYNKLSASGKTDSETKTQLLSIQNQLITSYGNEAKGLDLVNGKYDDQISKIQKLNKEKADEYIKTNQVNADNAQKTLSKVDTTSFGDGMFAFSGQNRIESVLANTKGLNIDEGNGINGKYNITGNLQQRVSVLDSILSKTKSINGLNADENSLLKKITDEYNKLNGNLQNAKTTVEKMNEAQLNSKYSKQMTDITNAVKQYQSAMDSGDNAGAQKANDSFQSLKNNMDKVLSESPSMKKAFDSWVDGLDMTSTATSKATDSISDFSSVEKNLVSNLDTAKTNVSSINKLLQDHAKNGEWDADTILTLAKTYPELLGVMGDDKALTEALTKAKQTETDTAESELNKQIELEKNKIQTTLAQYGLDISNFTSAEEAKTAILKAEVAKRIQLLQDEINANIQAANSLLEASEASLSSSESDKDDELYEKKQQQISALQNSLNSLKNASKLSDIDSSLSGSVDNYFNLTKLKNQANNILNNTGLSSSGTSAAEQAKKDAQDRIQAEKDANSAISSLREELVKALTAQQEKLKKAELDRIKSVYDAESKLIEAQKQSLSNNESDTEYQEQLATENKKKAELQAQYNAYKLDSTAKSQANDVKQQLDEQNQTINDLIRKHNVDLQNRNLDNQKSQLEDSYQKQQDSINQKYEDAENQAKLYAQANQMIMTNSMQTILGIINEYAPDFTQAGADLMSGMTNEVQKGMDALQAVRSGNYSSFMDGGKWSSNPTGSSSSSSGSSSGSSARTLSVGSMGSDVKQLQQYLGISADGIFGNQTRSALETWQRQHGLVADGVDGKLTHQKLGFKNGTDNVPDTDLAMVGEEGAELRVLNKGDGILTHERTKNLMALSDLYPSIANGTLPSIQSVLSNIQAPTISIPNISIPSVGSNVSNTSSDNIKFDINVNIQGNADNTAIEKLKTELSDAVINKLYQSRYKQGWRHS